MTNGTSGGCPLSALTCELLSRVYDHLHDPGAFGRVIQEIVVTGLRQLYPGLHDNRGAGTPDCQYHDGQGAWAWEVKFANGEGVQLGDRDLEGLNVVGPITAARSRLIVLDIAFPARLWILETSGLTPGHLAPEAHGHRHQEGEAQQLAAAVDNVIRRADVDVITSEKEAKALIAGPNLWQPTR